MDRQIRRFGIVAIVLFALLFLQLNNLQVFQAHKLANASGNARHILKEFAHPRGAIQTADGVVLAKSVPSHDFYKWQRVYPQGPLYAGITGYFSLVYGTSGVEQTYNKYLAGQQVRITHLSDLLTPNAQRVDNVTLTLSSKLQQVAANALAGRDGAVVALDPRSGAILAMVSNPGFNPAPLAAHNTTTAEHAWHADLKDPGQPLLPAAFRRRYPPGSTFKVVTSSAVYDHKPQLAAKAYPRQSQMNLPGTNRVFHNYANEVCGGKLPELLKVSCDTGFAQVGLDLGPQALAAEAQAFGFNQTPPLDVAPPPVTSNFPPASSFANNLPGLAYSAIGQENVAASPLQMGLVASAIADHGTIMAPHVMAQIRDHQGGLVRQWQAHPWLQATSAQTASQVGQMMVGVVNGGTASNIALPGVQLAAKTGTSQTGTGSNHTDDWMIAYGPAGAGQTPRVAVAVVVPHQASSATGSSVAGPVLKSVMAAALHAP
ncbi:MAG TPA: penicillin-binding transpeptidase domain-containing protein [Acidimicrobiales bacterium]|nr:penicillin-binding transpeptidase domain-containing protein [Acidimicrobiales bacterium]